MSDPSAFERRLSAVEARVEEARHLAAANDRDLSTLAVKVDANRKAINALGIQTAARFDRLEARVDRLEKKVDDGFAEMRAGFAQERANFAQINANFEQVDRNFLAMRGLLDATAASQQRTAELLTVLIDEREARGEG